MRAVLAALLLLGAGASRAADIPELLRGTWTEGGCATPAAAQASSIGSRSQAWPYRCTAMAARIGGRPGGGSSSTAVSSSASMV